MNILYYGETQPQGGGVSNVAYYLPQALSKKVGIIRFRGVKSNKNFPESYINIFNQFVKKKFDIIHFNTVPTWVNGSSMFMRFAGLGQTCTVLNIHGIPQLERRADQWNESISFIHWMRTLSYFNLADRIVVNSEFIRKNAIVLYGLNPDKVVVIPNGVDIKMFTEESNRIKLEGDPSVLYLGHFSMLKGLDVLIQAIAKLRFDLPNIKLHLVGKGNVSAFADLAAKAGIEKQIVFHGWSEHSMTPTYYKSADICVFPSRHEGFGIVILEAMASGVPVIASDIPSFREIISDRVDGLLFKSEDASSLSREIIGLYRDSRLKKELTQNAYEKVKSYSWEKIADKYISLYENLCERRQGTIPC